MSSFLVSLASWLQSIFGSSRPEPPKMPWMKAFILVWALSLGLAGSSQAATINTSIESGATFSAANYTYHRMTVINEPSSDFMPFRVYRITLPQSSSATGNYTFTLSTTGFGGSMNLYQGSFDPNQAGVNFWTNGALSSSAGTLTYTTNLPAYNSSLSSFEVVVSSANAGATGSFSLSVSGPAAVTVNARLTPSDFSFVDGPVDKTIVSGSSTNLYAYCTGPIPQGFQWYRGLAGDQSDPIVGATTHQIDVSPSVTTHYWLKIRKDDGTTVNSSTATITVTGSTTVPFSGSYVSNDRTLGTGEFYHVIPFKVTTAGDYHFHLSLGAKALYQGSFNPAQPLTNYFGGNDSNLPFGTFILVVSSNSVGDYNGDISGPQPVTLLPLPSLTIVENPDDAAVAPGGSATLAVATEGGGTPTYKWYKGESGDTSTPISGATAISYTTPALATTSKYWVRVSDGTTTIDSGSATVYVLTPPVVYSDQLISTDPTFNRPQQVGSTISSSGVNPHYKIFRFKISKSGNYTFSLSATGYQPAFALYQGIFIPTDAIVNLYDLSPLTANPTSKTITLSASSQYYYLVITAKTAAATGAFSLSVTDGPSLIVPDFPPIISTQPADQGIYVDSGKTATATFSVSTTNSTDSYQWYKGSTYANRTAIAGATAATYTTPATAAGKGFQYSVRLSNSGGYTDSRFATFTVLTKLAQTVTTLADTTDANDGLTSLREAITAVNTFGGGTITFASGLNGTITLGSALPAIISQLSIDGGNQAITVDGNSTGTCFTVTSGIVDILHLTIKGGRATSTANPAGGGLQISGGAVNVSGVLFLLNHGNTVIIRGNSTPSAGGAVNVDGGTVSLKNCTFSQNDGSTFSGAVAGQGPLGGSGGAQVNGGSLTISSCTLSQNTGGKGGSVTGTIGSTGGLGGSGGITRTGGTLTVANSIAYGNTVGASGSGGSPGTNPNPNLSGTYTTSGVNMTTDPKFSTLANHGGPTSTYSLLIGSSAVNAADPAYVTNATDYDQRGVGYPRVQSGRLDIGALEVRPSSVSVTLSSTSPKTNDVLTATPTTADFDQAPTFAYTWRVAGSNKQSSSSNTFNLATAGFGDKGQTVTCVVKATYNTQTATSMAASAVVANTTPVATASTVSYNRDTPVDFNLGGTDADRDTLTYKVTSLPTRGTLKLGSNVIDASRLPYLASGQLTYSPNFGTGSDKLNFSASDGADSSSAAVTLTMNNEATQSGPGFVVNKTADYDDGVCGVTDCTLREAISASNSYNAVHGNAGTQITFDAGIFGSTRQTITLNGNRLVLSSNMNITAPSPGLTLDGNHLSSVLYVNSGIAIFYNLTVTNGVGGTTGGGMTNTAAVSFHNCTFTGNSGGSGSGGAVYNSGLITVNTSTFSGNSAVNGGAFYNSGTLIISNSTISANTASGAGGGIYSVNGSGSIQSNNSIIAGNTAAQSPDLFGSVSTGDYNLVQSTSGATLSGTHNVTGVAAQLSALTENGGPVPTMALAPASPAINAGDPGNSGAGQTDQRGAGYPRVVLGRMDIGAFEAPAPPPLPQISVAAVSMLEGNGGTPQPMRFIASLSQASTSAVTMNYATVGGTATSGTDFTVTSGTLTIAAGDTSGVITVPITGDMVLEPDESFTLNLTAPVGALLAGGSSSLATTGTILNDDAAPVISLSGVTLAEGDAGTTTFAFKASLSAPAEQVVTVNYQTSNGTATAGEDYTAASGTLTFPAGSTSATVNVLVSGDITVEADETFNLSLSSPTVASFSGGAASISALGTILNDDDNVTPAATDVSGQVAVYKSSVTRDRATGRYKMNLVLQNNGVTLSGPLYLVLDGLGSGLSLYNSNGFTNRALPANSPYSTLALPGTAPGTLEAGTALNVTIELVNPANAAMTFSTRVLQGPGTP